MGCLMHARRTAGRRGHESIRSDIAPSFMRQQHRRAFESAFKSEQRSDAQSVEIRSPPVAAACYQQSLAGTAEND